VSYTRISGFGGEPENGAFVREEALLVFTGESIACTIDPIVNPRDRIVFTIDPIVNTGEPIVNTIDSIVNTGGPIVNTLLRCDHPCCSTGGRAGVFWSAFAPGSWRSSSMISRT
jgi:hypothetical protein